MSLEPSTGHRHEQSNHPLSALILPPYSSSKQRREDESKRQKGSRLKKEESVKKEKRMNALHDTRWVLVAVLRSDVHKATWESYVA